MLPVIEQLLILQDRDKKLAHLRLELSQVPAEEKTVDRKLADQTKAYEDLRDQTRQVEATRKKLELDAQSKRDSIARFKTQQFQTKKNEEYQALSHEIERFGKDVTVIEDQELELMEKYEQLKVQVAAEEKNVRQYQEQAAKVKAELKKKAEAIQAQILEIETQRTAAAGLVDPSVLSKYERILASKKDAAVVPLVHGTNCGGCHMKVTTTTILAVKNELAVTHCEICGRILYLGND